MCSLGYQRKMDQRLMAEIKLGTTYLKEYRWLLLGTSCQEKWRIPYFWVYEYSKACISEK